MDKALSISLVPVGIEEVQREWTTIEKGLEAALWYLEGAVLPIDVLKMLSTDMIIMTRIVEDGETLGYITLEKVIFPRKRYLRVFTMHGRELDVWLEEVTRQLLNVARQMQYDGIMAYMRPGIAKALRRLGHDTSLTMVTLHV